MPARQVCTQFDAGNAKIGAQGLQKKRPSANPQKCVPFFLLALPLQALLAACAGPAPALALLTLSSVIDGLLAHSGHALAAKALGGIAGGPEGVLERLASQLQVGGRLLALPLLMLRLLSWQQYVWEF
jgi:hypothetical protein